MSDRVIVLNPNDNKYTGYFIEKIGKNLNRITSNHGFELESIILTANDVKETINGEILTEEEYKVWRVLYE